MLPRASLTMPRRSLRSSSGWSWPSRLTSYLAATFRSSALTWPSPSTSNDGSGMWLSAWYFFICERVLKRGCEIQPSRPSLLSHLAQSGCVLDFFT